VSAPNEAEIVNLGIIDKTTAFSFVAQQNGTYTLNFENDLPDSIQVTFSYVTTPVIPGSNNSIGVSQSYLLITVIIAVLGSLLIIFILHRKSKTQTTAVHNTAPSNPSSHLTQYLIQKNQKPNNEIDKTIYLKVWYLARFAFYV
jgi:hypothetical protein